ncbi:MAG: SurA N-terminal domain-containing protein [Gammaproteobacteria bacterium]|nr:SurA N-terminal domain-containing protein [Gammaproteobacteria bacterium]
MLSSIKEKAQGWIAWLIVIFISIPFALWGINSYFEAQSSVVVAEVNGAEIDNDSFQAELSRIRQLFSQQNRGAATDELDTPEFRRSVLNRMIDAQLLAQAAVEDGFRISDSQLNEFIRGYAGFQQNGKFSPALYDAFVRNRGFRDPAALEEEFRSENQMQQLMNGFTETVFITGADQARLLSLQAQQREFDWIVLDPQVFQAGLSLSEEEIRAWYDEHADDYRRPERVRVAYLRLSAAEVAKRADFNPSEEELKAAYEASKDRFVIEQRRARHILLAVPPGASEERRTAALDQARDLVRQLREGADFAKLAAEYSADPGSKRQGGDLGFLRRGASEPEFDAALFALDKDAISDPVATRFGIHIIRLDDISEENRSFAEVREELEKSTRARKAEATFFADSQRFEELVYDQPDSLRAAAETLGLKVQESDWIGRQGGTGIAATPEVVEAAFSDDVVKNGNNSATIEIAPDDLVALRLIAHEPAELRPLEDVRDRIETELRTRKARELAVAEGERLLGELRAGKTLAELASARGLTPKSPGLVDRRHAGTDFRVLAAAFRAPRPAADRPAYAGVNLGEDGYGLLALRRVQEGDPAAGDPQLRKAASDLLGRQRGYGQFLDYRADLRAKADLSIHEDQL